MTLHVTVEWWENEGDDIQHSRQPCSAWLGLISWSADWSPQHDVEVHFSKSWLCINFPAQSCWVFLGGPPVVSTAPNQTIHIKMNAESCKFTTTADLVWIELKSWINVELHQRDMQCNMNILCVCVCVCLYLSVTSLGFPWCLPTRGNDLKKKQKTKTH